MILYIDVNAKELNQQCEGTRSNLAGACQAMLESMLEGDSILSDSKTPGKPSAKLTIRYYTDNLHPGRKPALHHLENYPL